MNGDGMDDIIVADISRNSISIILQSKTGPFQEIKVASDIIAPSHVQAFDFDKDGKLEILVSVLGMLFPNNDKIGSIVYLHNEGKLKFTKHVLIEKITRASDVRAGDVDGDGDNDLVVSEFGYDDGETRWMENLGDLKFKSHILQSLSGGINCEISDFDNDGDLDIALLVSQEWEEIYLLSMMGQEILSPNLSGAPPILILDPAVLTSWILIWMEIWTSCIQTEMPLIIFLQDQDPAWNSMVGKQGRTKF
jgi:hypothetical protein